MNARPGALPDVGSEALSRELDADLHRLRELLRKCLVLAGEDGVRRLVLGGASELVFRHRPGACYARVGRTEFKVGRDCGTVEAGSLSELFSHPALGADHQRLDRYGRDADRLIQSLLRGERGRWPEIVEWAPVIEMPAYSASARLAQFLDAGREEARVSLAAGRPEASVQVQRYWAMARLMARLTLLSTTPGATRWLVGVARTVAWIRWTPSYPLVRERTLVLALVGARAAAAFGPEVLDGYVGALGRAPSALAGLDAVLGLAVLAIVHPPTRPAVDRALRRSLEARPLRDPDDAEVLALGINQALLVIAEGDDPHADRTFQAAKPLEHPFAFVDGRCAALTHLRAALRAPAPLLLPAGGEGHGRSDVAEAVFRRAWGPSVAAGQTVH